MCSRDTWRKFNAMTPRGNDAEKSGIETVGVGFPNPWAGKPRPYDGCRVLNFGALVHLAPEGRHVYRTAACPNTPKPQRGDMCSRDT